MINAKFGLIAIPMMFMMMCVPTGVQACMGGEPGHTWFHETVNATAHNYTARSFVVEKAEQNVYVQYDHTTKVYILKDEAMGNFTAGRPCTMAFNSSRDYKWVNLTAGKYWIVLDNKEGDGAMSREVRVERLALKESGGCGDNPYLPNRWIPGPSSGVVAVAMIVAALAALFIKKRTN